MIFGEETKEYGPIVCVFGSHTKEYIEGKNLWSENVLQQISSLKPTCLIVDGFDTRNSTFSKEEITSKIPVKNIISWIKDKGPLRVVSWDINTSSQSAITRVIYKPIAEGSGDSSLEEYLGQGKAHIPLNESYRENFRLKTETERWFFVAISIIGFLLTEKNKPLVSRRNFLKMGLASIPAIIINARIGLLNHFLEAMKDNTDPSKNDFFSLIARICSPMGYESALTELRNIKAGLVSYQIQEKDREEKIAIVFGRAHSMEINPTKNKEDLEKKLRYYIEFVSESLRDTEGFLGNNLDILIKIKESLIEIFCKFYSIEFNLDENDKITQKVIPSELFNVREMIDELIPTPIQPG